MPVEPSELPESGLVIYVVEYSFDAVKVGYTSRPRQRLYAHDLAARQLGIQVTRLWLSEPHENARMNEKRLIRFCAEHSQRTTGSDHGEYFSSLPFEAVCNFANSLPFEPIAEQQQPLSGAECPACDAADRRPLSALALLHQVAHGKLRIVDPEGHDVSNAWTGAPEPNH